MGLFKEYTDGYEGLGRGFGADDDNPAYGQGCTGTERGARQMAELRADNERAVQRQIDGGVVIRRTNRAYDLWEIYAPDGKLKLKGGFNGVEKAIKYAKKEGLKIIGIQHGSGKIEPLSESGADIANDPALVCPYCGGNNCEVSIGTDDLNFTYLDKLDGETFNVECWCNDCDKPYNVTVELKVKDVYPNEDADKLTGDYI